MLTDGVGFGGGGAGPAILVRAGAADDLDAIVAFRPAAIVLAEADNAGALAIFSARIAAAEALAGVDDGATPLIAMIETPSALLALAGIAGATHRLSGLILDPAALARRLGLASPHDGKGRLAEPLLTARTLVLAAAATAGIPAFVGIGGQNAEDEISGARLAGFAGLMTDDPEKVAAINSTFGGES